MKKYIIFVLFFSICAGNFAQPDSTKRDTTKKIDIFELSLEELMKVEVITSTKKSQKISEAPSIISAITREELLKIGATTLIDALRYVPGIEVSMDINGFYRVAIRGFRKDGNILVLMDGFPVNEFYDGKSIYDFPIDFISKVEVIRGPGSALFGTNAVVGIINILTTKNIRSISVQAGTCNSYSGNVQFSDKIKDVKYSLCGGYSSTKGANVNPYSDSQDGKTNRWLNDAYLQTSLTWDKLDFRIWGMYRNQGPWTGPLYEPAPDSDFKNTQIQANLSYKIGNDKISVIPKIYYQYILHDYLIQEHFDGYKGAREIFTDGALVKENYATLKSGQELQIDYVPSNNFNLIGGIVYENLHLASYDLQRNYRIATNEYKGEFGNYDSVKLNQKDKERTIFATYLQTQYRWQWKLILVLGFRFDIYSDFGNSFNPRVGFVYKLTRKLNLKALYGQAFRAPTFKELYDKTSYNNVDGVVGVDSLKPEIIRSAELGLEYQHRIFFIRANVFYNSNSNIIDIWDEARDGTVGQFQNIGQITSFGGEAEIGFAIAKRMNFSTNVAYFHKEFDYNTDKIFELQDQTMHDRGSQIMKNSPNLRINSTLSVSFYKFNIFAGVNYGSETFSNERGQTELQYYAEIPAYLQTNFSVTYIPFPAFAIKICGVNIGEKFSDPSESSYIGKFGIKGMRQPSSLFLASVSYKF